MAPLVKMGSEGPWVSYLQALLKVPATGVFDDATDAAVRAWPKSKELTVDGVIGPASWTALGVSAGGGGGGTVHPPGGGGGGQAPPPVNVPAPPPSPAVGNPFGLAELRPEREAQMLGMIADGQYDHLFTPLTWSKNGHEITALVSRRALALSDGVNRLTVNASFETAQKVADMLGAHMLTSRVADEIYKQAPTKIGIPNKSWNTDSPVTGGKLSRMYEQSSDVAAKVAAKGDTGLVANEGKDWVLTRRYWNPPEGTGQESPKGTKSSRHNGANYGWYPGGSTSPGGVSIIQNVGLAHEPTFTDYSQYLRFMLPAVTVDGQSMTSAAVLADPSLSYLLNDEGGTVPATRHPDF